MTADSSLVGYFSIGKLVAITALACMFAAVPSFTTAQDVTYTKVFFTPVGHLWVLACQLIALVLVLSMLPFIVRAFLSRPAIEVFGDRVRVWRFNWRDCPFDCFAGGVRRQFGSLSLRGPNGKQFVIPLWMYRDPSAIVERLPTESPTP